MLCLSVSSCVLFAGGYGTLVQLNEMFCPQCQKWKRFVVWRIGHRTELGLWGLLSEEAIQHECTAERGQMRFTPGCSQLRDCNRFCLGQQKVNKWNTYLYQLSWNFACKICLLCESLNFFVQRVRCTKTKSNPRVRWGVEPTKMNHAKYSFEREPMKHWNLKINNHWQLPFTTGFFFNTNHTKFSDIGACNFCDLSIEYARIHGAQMTQPTAAPDSISFIQQLLHTFLVPRTCEQTQIYTWFTVLWSCSHINAKTNNQIFEWFEIQLTVTRSQSRPEENSTHVSCNACISA